MAKAVWTAEQRSTIEAQLQRIGGSAVFTNAGRMFPLLQYLVRAELEGTATKLNQHRIAIDVLGRDERFDPSTDSIVRVDMGRLRGKLREYYATDGSKDGVIIGLPKGRYRPSIDLRGAAAVASPPPAPKQNISFCRTRDGTNIAWSISGSGYPMIKAANWMSHLEYDHQSPVWRHWWAELARRFELIRYDERGCGLSDWDAEDISFTAWLEDFDAVVEAAGRDRFALLGISQGASVAIHYAVRHPERVSHLVLFGGFVQGRHRRDSREADEATVLEQLIRVGWGQTHGAFRQVFGSMFMPEGTAEHFRYFDDLQRATSSPENAEKIFRVSQSIDVAALCQRVRVPTLVLHARNEIVIPFSQARLMASTIPGAKLVPLDSRNHLIFEHEPAWQKFLDEVESFVRSEGAPG
ncbi:MAG TPA: alpha/beta hydrolase [Gammaproteobacteria bacterium]